MMELYIETLMGAAFELRVSPFETIMSVKAKIQRLEGIPISQQHLIWQTVELDDDYCLHDYDIHNGATLKLVLAMRGGPINTRRVPIEDSSVFEYMESTPDDLDKGGSRQVTLLVFKEGDQWNFFRVVDRGDGTLTPLSESLSAASMYNTYDEEEEGEGASKQKNEENAKIKEKIDTLKNKMDNMSISKKIRKMLPTPPVQGRPASSTRLQAIRGVQAKTTSATLNRNRCLPPVSHNKSTGLSEKAGEHGSTTFHSAQSSSDAHYSDIAIPKPPAELSGASNKHTTTNYLHSKTSVSSLPVTSTPNKPYSARSHRRHNDSDMKYSGHHISDSRIKCIPEDEALHSEKSPSSMSSSNATFSKCPDGLSMERLKEPLRGASTLSEVSITPHLRRSSSHQHDYRSSSRQHADLTLETLKESFYSQRIALESLTSNEAKMMSGLLQQASLERLHGPSSIGTFSPVKTRKAGIINQFSIDESVRTLEKTSSATLPKVDNPENIGSSSAKLPPVKSKKKAGKTKRCFVCMKKTGLATSYLCRCGNNYCATHRYAEMHDCTFDYKTEGRQLLEQNNPVISAPKLPKI